jgi:hypothetical protein
LIFIFTIIDFSTARNALRESLAISLVGTMKQMGAQAVLKDFGKMLLKALNV